MNTDFVGAGTALITPFKNNGEIDFVALGKIVDRQIVGGIDYLVMLGTTAETPTLSDEEKKDIVDFIKERTGGKIPLVAGMGGNCTKSVLAKMESFDCSGISAFLSVTPYYNKPTQEGLFRHYSELGKHSPLPVILYNVPSRTGANLSAETTVRLAAESEKFVAVKEAAGSIQQVSQIIKHAPPHFKIISGDDIMALPFMSLGGHGIISVIANALPQKLSSMVHLALKGDFAEAAKIHIDLTELLRLQFADGNPAGVKAMLLQLGIIENVLRLPLVAAGDATVRKIAEELVKLA
ncbi:MAG: 4-hydroxy-tetrahydrodipicolinate synthase [Prolixibacteraceae bacterium]|nr:4-hydroxy-tetrahydrodipicolinate synthase [Prolixibacteraceae bacterium]